MRQCQNRNGAWRKEKRVLNKGDGESRLEDSAQTEDKEEMRQYNLGETDKGRDNARKIRWRIECYIRKMKQGNVGGSAIIEKLEEGGDKEDGGGKRHG
jgi:hypothetical protein